VTGVSESQLFAQGPSSGKQREEKRESHRMIKIAKETTVHIVIIQCTDLKIKHTDRQD